MQNERSRPPDTLGSALEQVQRRRVALAAPTSLASGFLARLPTVESPADEINRKLLVAAWERHLHADGSSALVFKNKRASAFFEHCTRKGSSDEEFAEGIELASAEYAQGRLRFLSADAAAERELAIRGLFS